MHSSSDHKWVNGIKVPLTEEDIRQREIDEEAHKVYIEELNRNRYKVQRQKKYPEIGDQLDAILKQLNYMQMSGQTNLVSQLDDIIGQWLAVKREYPKPTDVVKQ